ncbi:MAG: hypothetical protein K9J06_11830 [Flavobacteriales bacterium]|nr:hypothetical protein [Flavobacteriales bacterium]
MKKLLATSALGLFCMGQLMAQNELDALRYSQLNVTGTSRYAAMGGAFGALGGDMTTLSVNPAGIGVFAKTEASFTLGILSTATDANYLGTTASNSRLNLNIGNAGFVARFNRRKGEDRQWAWKAFHIGVAYNRTASFNARTSVVGVNTQSSYIDQHVNALNTFPGVNSNSPYNTGQFGFGTELMYDAYLFDPVYDADTNFTGFRRAVLPNYGQTESVTEITRGSMGEIALSFGGNYGNALYFGATIGIPTVSYDLERRYNERDTQDTIANFNAFTKRDNLSVSGNGFNVKFGLIYRPVQWLRIGAAVHTPTFFEMDENYSSAVTSEVFGTQYNVTSPEGKFDYSLETPFRAIGSLAFVVAKIGVISADYEFVDYRMARMRSNDYAFDAENTSVQNRLNWAGNIRVGTEWRLDIVSIRGGFAINGNPFTGAYSLDDTRWSLGAGLRLNRWSLDLTYMLHRWAGNYEVYSPELTPLADITMLNHNVMFTTSFRF